MNVLINACMLTLRVQYVLRMLGVWVLGLGHCHDMCVQGNCVWEMNWICVIVLATQTAVCYLHAQ